MRSLALALAAVVASLAIAVSSRAEPPPARTPDEMARARVLDQQGAKAYSEGRYNDAIRYFEEAHRLGGPPFELWNIAKCQVRLDQPEQASEMLEKYLATPNLPPEDRDEAAQQLDALRKRPSTLTVASSPSGASLAIDGKPVDGARTPVSVSVAPGSHDVSLTLPNHAKYTKQIDAKYGRAIILDAPLEKDGAPQLQPQPPAQGSAPSPDGRVALRGLFGVDLPRFGGVAGSVQPTGIVSGTYRIAEVGPTSFALGGLASLTGDAWANTINSANTAQGCSTLQNPQNATALSIFGLGTAGWAIVPSLRVRALGGFGLEAYFAGDVGGDVFVPACNTGTGVRPAVLAGVQVDYSVSRSVRLTALPLMVQLHQAFSGVRTSPVDASGLWLRATLAVGIGVDL